ncbi:MAG TPA: sensor histidine kinase, partial [Puia sp.]
DLDISQTVPLGLIINEAVTNAVKHAFKDDRAGTAAHPASTLPGIVSISLKQTEKDHLLLTITDNGRGLPSDFDIGASKTLGIQLIKTFSDQLDGKLTFVSQNGFQLRLLFREEAPTANPAK